MRTTLMSLPSRVSEAVPTIRDARMLRLTFWFVLIANLACSFYAARDARGLYSDGVGYLVTVYGHQWFSLFDTRTIVQILRQAPVVLLSRYTSATLFQCGQVFTFVMLSLPTLLCALCWFIAPHNRKTWVLFPLAYLLIGFAATSIHAIGEAAIAASYYWILLFLLLFRTGSTGGRALFLLLCIPAFRLHEATFPLTAVLVLAIVLCPATDRRETPFFAFAILLLAAIFVYQVRWVAYPQFPDDRRHIVQGLTRLEFLYVDDHFNLPLATGALALLALSTVFFLFITQPSDRARRLAGMIAVAWALVAFAAMAVAVMVEQSFSPFAQLQARYHPVIISAVLGTAMILLSRYNLPDRLWMQPATIFILILLCAAQSVADVAATRRWNAYVVDLQSRLVNGRGLIRWETTLHTASERADINWRLMKIGWTLPFSSIAFAPNGVVNAIIAAPIDTTFRPFDPAQPDQLPKLNGVDYSPYERFLAVQKSGGQP